ncbi:hypothetical protein SEA_SERENDIPITOUS_18 [Mycobacterium phage Serendipitous]|uniref:Uncharacterized protein n=1 Tax=Mycobacterium phage Serendipitous TaxID=2301619 RepID=A0A385UHX3_9CAUD|nr:hypothetical protein I5G64_gp18 [Mycobacterium phage Serendipitous]AYB70560.1 hypothetical protein SEA_SERENDIPITOUS_18 [Mycobacterium phage Serendipitous]
MTSVLSLLYSLPFAIGLVIGVAGMKVYQHAQCKIADAQHPLPGGRHRHPAPISRVWVGGFLTIAVLGYVLLQVGQIETRYKGLADNVERCQVEFQQAITARSKITTENDQLSRQRQDLLQEYGRATSLWLSQLVNLPEDIADLSSTDPRVIAWGQAVTRVYSEHALRINSKLNDIGKRQEQLEQDRRDHPLPQATCGVS